MQWGKRQLGGEYQFIVHSDPALDSDVEDFQERYGRYRDTGEVVHLPIRSGAKPLVFVLTHPYGLPFTYLQEEYAKCFMDKAMEQDTLVAKFYYRACQLALVGVKGLTAPDGKGEFELLFDTDPVTRGNRVSEISMGHLQNLEDTTGYQGSVVRFLGQEVTRRLFVVPLSKRG